MSNLNWVDYIFLAIFLFSTLAGLTRGFVREVISLITLIAAFVIAILLAHPLAAMFSHSSTVQNAVEQASNAQSVSYVSISIAFALLFMGTIIVGAIISSVLSMAFRVGILGFGNRLLGGIFGFIRALIINLVIIFVVQLSPIAEEDWWQKSQVVAQYQPAIQWLGDIVSPGLSSLKERFGQTVQTVNEKLQSVSE